MNHEPFPRSERPSPPIKSRMRGLLRKASMARLLAPAHARGCLLSLLRGLWFTRVGGGTKFFGWPRVQYWGGPITIGRRCSIGIRAYFLVGPTGRITIGDNVNINDFCFLTSLSSIEIDHGVSIAEFVSIRDYDHKFDGVTPVDKLGYTSSAIRICKGAWVGRGAMITKGVTIGEGSVIGANSVVTRDVPPHSVAVGSPARVIRQIGAGEDVIGEVEESNESNTPS